jgi:NAD(P)-dependent dehydrogenase (short-subunit alcohol dehydrogenase family)
MMTKAPPAGLSSLSGRVAVITGGASGIGRGIAEEFIERGAKVVIADIELDVLQQTAAEIGATAVHTDVSNLASIRALADATLAKFGRVDILCNNAGVGPIGRIEDTTLDDWKFVIDVNLWGVIYGVDVFLPHLIANPDGGHIVNTASQAGLAPFRESGAYALTKYGVVALTETLSMELDRDHPKVGATVLCPGPVRSNIQTSQRNRPAALAHTGLHDMTLVESTTGVMGRSRVVEPRDVGRLIVDCVRERRLYAITHPEMFELIGARHRAIAAAHAV